MITITQNNLRSSIIFVFFSGGMLISFVSFGFSFDLPIEVILSAYYFQLDLL